MSPSFAHHLQNSIRSQSNLFHPWINLYSLSQMKSLIHKPLSLITKTRIRGLDAFTRADPVSPAAPRVAPVPSPAPARYAQPVQVYRRRSAPTPAPQRYAEPVQVYRRRLASTTAPPPAPEAPATLPEQSPPPPPPAPSRAEPEVYHPPIIHRDPRHIHPMVTRRMASQAATLSATEGEPRVSPIL